MLVDDDGHRPANGEPAPGFHLGFAVADMYSDLRISPVLRRLLTHSRELLQTVAGSISLVDPAGGSYAKVAENGVACQLGRTFPLHEGATGQAVARRMPVVIDDYGDLPAGHLPHGHPASRGAAAAVPLWWRGEVIGVNVAFAGRQRRFTAAEIDAFELAHPERRRRRWSRRERPFPRWPGCCASTAGSGQVTPACGRW